MNFPSDGTLVDTCNPKECIASRLDSPYSGSNSLQLWAKPQPKGAVAAVILNGDGQGEPKSVDIDLSLLNITATSVNVRDIWLHKDLGTATKTFSTDPIAGYDSRFYMFTPVNL